MDKLNKAQWTFLQHLAVQAKSRSSEEAVAIALVRTRHQFGDNFFLSDAQVAMAHATAAEKMGAPSLKAARKVLGDRAAELGRSPEQLLSQVRTGLEQLVTLLEERAAPPASAKSQIDRALAYTPSKADQQDLARLVAAPRPDGDAIMEVLARSPGIAALFDEWIGTRETYSIREHSQMVHAQLLEQAPHYPLPAVPGVDLQRLFAILPALHDIGKAAAVELGDTKLQHGFTVPLLEHVLVNFGFNPKEIKMAEAIVEHDAIGNMVAGPNKDAKPEDAKAELDAVAAELGVPPADFFKIKVLFFVIDASAYPLLREDPEGRFFVRDAAGKISPKDPRFAQLSGLYEHGAHPPRSTAPGLP